MRHQAAILLNLLVPGAGLILVRREYLGTAIAMLYGMVAGLGLWGCLIEPARMPTWLATSSLALAGLIWLSAQVLLRRRLPVVRNPEVSAEVRSLRHQAADYAAGGRYDDAWGALQVALTLNDEDLETNLQSAELLMALGRFGDARRAWSRAAQLDRTRVHERRIRRALREMPAR